MPPIPLPPTPTIPPTYAPQVTDGGAVLVVTAATTLPVARSSLSPVVTATASTPTTVIMSVAGMTATSTFYISLAGQINQAVSPSTYPYNAQVLRKTPSTTTTLYSSIASAGTLKYPWGSGSGTINYFGAYLTLSSANEL